MDEYLEKKKELQEAEQKAIEIKKTLRAEKKEELKEKFDKYNFLHKLKPWTRNDVLLGILMIVLFLVAYNHGGPIDSGENEGFFSNVFGFLVKDAVDTEDNIDSTEDSGDSTDSTDDISDTGDSEETNDSTGEMEDTENEEENVINFNIWSEYNDNQFTTLDTTSSPVNYYVVIQNLESFDIWCESFDSSVGIEAGEEREIFAMASENDAGDDGKLIVDQEFTCYDVDETIDGGYSKTTTLTFNFI